jgi:hypothetical protein
VGLIKHHPHTYKDVKKNSKPCTPSPIYKRKRRRKLFGILPSSLKFNGEFEVGVAAVVEGVSECLVPRASSSRIFTALQFQRSMHESSIAATARVLARNVIVEGAREGPSTATGS